MRTIKRLKPLFLATVMTAALLTPATLAWSQPSTPANNAALPNDAASQGNAGVPEKTAPVYGRGMPVVIVKPEVSIRRGEETVAKVKAGRMLVVRDVKDNLLHVGGPFFRNRASAPQPGWISPTDVLPPDQAIAHFTKLIEKEPDNEFWLAARANTYRQHRHYDQAIADYDQLLKKSPKNAVYANGRARARRIRDVTNNAQYDRDKYNAMRAQFQQAIEFDPKLTAAHTNLAVLAADHGMFDQALESFGKAIELESKNPAHRLNRAIAYANLQAYEQFLADCNEALRLDPLYYDALRYRAMYWRNQGKLAEELADLNKLIQIDAKDPSHVFTRGLLHFRLGQSHKAIGDFDKVIELAPQHRNALVYRATIWRILKEYDKAIEAFDIAIKAYPNDGMIINDRGVSWMQKGDLDKALADFAKASQLQPNIVAAHTHTAMILAAHPEAEKRDPRKALEHAQTSLKLSQFENFYSLDVLATAYAANGDFEKAVQTAERAFANIEETKKHTTLTEEIQTAAGLRLELFKQGQPYVMEPAVKSGTE